MPAKARTRVPTHLTIATKPELRIELAGPLRITVRGRKDSVIAHIDFGRRDLEILGSDESEPMRLPYGRLKRKGIDALRGFVDEALDP